MTLFDLTGFCGVTLSIYCYARMQLQRDYAKKMSYSALNLISCGFYLISLSHNWNLPAVVSNCIWAGFSAYGMWRCWKYIVRDRAAQAAEVVSPPEGC